MRLTSLIVVGTIALLVLAGLGVFLRTRLSDHPQGSGTSPAGTAETGAAGDAQPEAERPDPDPSPGPVATSPSPAATAGSNDDEQPPEESRAAVITACSKFIEAWLETHPLKRFQLLQQTATERLTDLLRDTDPAKIRTDRPTGPPELVTATAYDAQCRQRFEQKPAVVVAVVFEPGSPNGWLATAVAEDPAG